MKFLPPDIKKANIHIGGVFVSSEPAVVRTVLGSCIAACLFDPLSLVGGMNHFMLPSGLEDGELPTRYGVQAMEVLINNIMQLGGERRRLQAKVFGGADVLKMQGNYLRVAEKNRHFIQEFLETEGIRMVAHRVGGVDPLQVYFFTHTAKVLVRPLRRENVDQLIDQEGSYRAKISREATKPQSGDVTLF
ncbi:MAG: chemotaxis protein CheD [Candidatus Binatia bacterium]